MKIKRKQLQNKKKFKINKEENIFAHQRKRRNIIES
jgi:hypothetical protein